MATRKLKGGRHGSSSLQHEQVSAGTFLYVGAGSQPVACSKDVRFHHCAFDPQAVGFALLAVAASHFPDELLDDISASRPCEITPCKSVRGTQRTSAKSRHTRLSATDLRDVHDTVRTHCDAHAVRPD